MNEDENKNLHSQINELRDEIERLNSKLKPDNLAKTLDNSYLSINNIRLMLQILAIIITIFLAGAVGFGIFGVSNIFSIHENANKIESIRDSINIALENALKLESDVFSSVKNIENEVGSKVENIKKTENDIIENIQQLDNNFLEKTDALDKKTREAISELNEKINIAIKSSNNKLIDQSKKFDKEIKESENTINEINKRITDISEIFNYIGVKYENDLNTREKLLLALIAKEIDPYNPIFNYNYGQSIFSMHRFAEAKEFFLKVIASNNVPDEIVNRSRELVTQCDEYIKNPPEIDWPKAEPGKEWLWLNVNTMNILISKGYLELEDVKMVLDKTFDKKK